MNTMKKTLLTLLFTFISANAQVFDAIAIDVEGEAITTLEIEAAQQKGKLSKQAAVEALIRDRLEKSAVKKAGITVSDEEVQAKINAIASSKGLSQAKMQAILKEKGLSWENYIEQIKKEIKKEKFFQEVIMASIDRPSDSELEAFYQTHQDEFSSAPTQMSLVVYSSPSSESLKSALTNPMAPTPNVKKENVLASSDEMNPQLLNLIKQTEVNSFTPPINTGEGFVSYYVKSKGTNQSGFMAVKSTVLQRWMQTKKAQAIQDFLNKLKANAQIRVIRL